MPPENSDAAVIQNNGERSPTRDSVFALLQDEIRDAETERAKRGWNVWLLAAGMAALIWSALGLYENPAIDLTTSVRIAVMATLLVQGVRSTIQGLGRIIGSGNYQERFILPSTIGLVQRQLWLLAPLTLLFLGAVLYLAPSTPSWVTMVVVAFVATDVLAIVAATAAVSMELPVPNMLFPGSRNDIARVGGYTMVLAMAMAALAGLTGYSTSLRWVPPGTFLGNLRLGLVVSAIWFLLPILLTELLPSPFLEELRAIRRSLELGVITPQQAHQRTEAVVVGVEGSVAASRMLRRVGDRLDTIDSNLVSHLEALSKIDLLVPTALMGGEAALAAQAQVLTLLAGVKDSSSEFTKARGEFEKLNRRAKLVAVISPSLLPHLTTSVSGLSDRLNAIEVKQNAAGSRLAELRAKMEPILQFDAPAQRGGA